MMKTCDDPPDLKKIDLGGMTTLPGALFTNPESRNKERNTNEDTAKTISVNSELEGSFIFPFAYENCISDRFNLPCLFVLMITTTL